MVHNCEAIKKSLSFCGELWKQPKIGGKDAYFKFVTNSSRSHTRKTALPSNFVLSPVNYKAHFALFKTEM